MAEQDSPQYKAKRPLESERDAAASPAKRPRYSDRPPVNDHDDESKVESSESERLQACKTPNRLDTLPSEIMIMIFSYLWRDEQYPITNHWFAPTARLSMPSAIARVSKHIRSQALLALPEYFHLVVVAPEPGLRYNALENWLQAMGPDLLSKIQRWQTRHILLDFNLAAARKQGVPDRLRKAVKLISRRPDGTCLFDAASLRRIWSVEHVQGHRREKGGEVRYFESLYYWTGLDAWINSSIDQSLNSAPLMMAAIEEMNREQDDSYWHY